MMRVPFVDLGAQYASIRTDIDRAIAQVVDEASFILGENVEDFERRFAAYTQRHHCVGVNSGTSALHLALLAAGIDEGDEVVTTPLSWISTSWAISYCRARPVFADIDPATGNLDPKAAESVITPTTRALLPVDLYGNPARLDLFEDLADRYDLPLIDDAAQAHGARLGGRMVGSFGDVACFSFYPGKNLGAAGEAGAVVTDDAEVAARVRQLRDHAQASRHHHTEIGFNYRMEGLQGKVLAVKLEHLDAWNAQRRQAAARYDEMLGSIPGIELPVSTQDASPCFHLYPVRVANRDAVVEELAGAGIGTGVHYPTPIHLQPAYAPLGHGPGDFPNAEDYAARCVSLPMFAEITLEQQEYVVETLAGIVEE